MALDNYAAMVSDLFNRTPLDGLQEIPILGRLFVPLEERLLEAWTLQIDRHMHEIGSVMGIPLQDNPFKNNIYEFLDEAFVPGMTPDQALRLGYVTEHGIGPFKKPRVTKKLIFELLHNGTIVLDGTNYNSFDFLKIDISPRYLWNPTRPVKTALDFGRMILDHTLGLYLPNSRDTNDVLETMRIMMENPQWYDVEATGVRNRGLDNMYARLTGLIRTASSKIGVVGGMMNMLSYHGKTYADFVEKNDFPWYLPFGGKKPSMLLRLPEEFNTLVREAAMLAPHYVNGDNGALAIAASMLYIARPLMSAGLDMIMNSKSATLLAQGLTMASLAISDNQPAWLCALAGVAPVMREYAHQAAQKNYDPKNGDPSFVADFLIVTSDIMYAALAAYTTQKVLS